MSTTVPSILPRTYTLAVNEVFGPTIQGEGPDTGRRATFVRLAGCNLACSWCDTPYSWDWKRFDKSAESHVWLPTEFAKAVRERGAPLLVITGGEPMMQQRGLLPALWKLNEGAVDRIDVAIETNGTRMPTSELIEQVDRFVVSPKLANGGDVLSRRVIESAMRSFRQLSILGNAVFKFVVASEADLDEVAALCDLYRIDPAVIYAMPLGATQAEHLMNLALLADPIIERGWNISTRLHVLAWGTERGR